MMKFMLSLHESQGEGLQVLANERGITIQELLRSVVIPEWARGYGVMLNGEKKLIEKGKTQQ